MGKMDIITTRDVVSDAYLSNHDLRISWRRYEWQDRALDTRMVQVWTISD